MSRLLIDTNLAILLLVGSVTGGRLGTRRTDKWDGGDYRRLLDIVGRHAGQVSTPTVLAELSNLLSVGRREIAAGASEAFAACVAQLDEIFDPSRSLVGVPAGQTLGLADAAIVAVGQQRPDVTILTDDGRLHDFLGRHGAQTINFLHPLTPG